MSDILSLSLTRFETKYMEFIVCVDITVLSLYIILLVAITLVGEVYSAAWLRKQKFTTEKYVRISHLQLR